MQTTTESGPVGMIAVSQAGRGDGLDQRGGGGRGGGGGKSGQILVLF